ncbi:MAG TPA: hypothetical protein VGJ70_08920, partial [Solirubrobacteraceae bacterium]
GLLLVVTGLAFILMGWLGAGAPMLMIVGSGCAAIGFESQLAQDSATGADLGAAAVDPSFGGAEAGVPTHPASDGGTNQAA